MLYFVKISRIWEKIRNFSTLASSLIFLDLWKLALSRIMVCPGCKIGIFKPSVKNLCITILTITFSLSSWLIECDFFNVIFSCLSLYQYSKTKILFHLCKSVFCKVSYKTTVGFKLFPSDFFFN